MATLGDLAGQILHDTHNDVGGIKHLANRLINLDGSDKLKDWARQIRELSDKILRDAKHRTGWILDQPRAVSIPEQIEAALDHTSLPASVKVTNNVPADLPRVVGGEHQLESVFANLIRNAFHALDDQGGTLDIIGKTHELAGKQWVVIQVEDSGHGIAPEHIDKIFDRHFSSSEGIGYGLWWSRMYIERIHGRLEVESQLERGSRFVVRIPVERDAREDADHE